MPVQINTQPTIISWDVKRGSLEQNGNSSQALNISTVKPGLEMETKLPKIKIDQSAPFSDAGLKNMKAMLDESVSYGKQIVSQGVDRIVSQGNAFIEIYNNYDPIPDQAISNAYEMFDKEFNYGAIPSSRPSISLDEGKVNYRYIPGRVNNNSTPQKVQMTYNPGKINYYVKQYASINFRYEKSEFKFSV